MGLNLKTEKVESVVVLAPLLSVRKYNSETAV